MDKAYDLPEVQKAKIAVTLRERGLENLARRHAKERAEREQALEAARAYLESLLNQER